MAAPPPAPTTDLGGLLRHWRAVRRTSQLELAGSAGTTPRYVSFMETGRAQPSRHMVLRLARALDVPLRERNDLLLAAGYAPVYSLAALDSPQLARVDAALGAILAGHEPFPAVVMDRRWDVRRANAGAGALFGRLLAPEPIPEPANVLQLVLEPGPVRDRIRNWDAVARALLDRTRREAVAGVPDDATAALVARLRARPEVAAVLDAEVGGDAPVAGPVIDLQFDLGHAVVGFFSVVSTIGTPIDVTAQELRVEAFFPSDEASADAWRSFSPPTVG
jgi:transcriptional regulator with XRE-family HTH domain